MEFMNLVSDIEKMSENVVEFLDNSENDYIKMSDIGSSGSKIIILKNYLDDKVYAVKCARKPRISLEEEAERRKKLEPFLDSHLPNIILNTTKKEFDIMVSECKGIENLFSAILKGNKPLNYYLNIWNSFLNELAVYLGR